MSVTLCNITLDAQEVFAKLPNPLQSMAGQTHCIISFQSTRQPCFPSAQCRIAARSLAWREQTRQQT
jgi:hypothetical protein